MAPEGLDQNKIVELYGLDAPVVVGVGGVSLKLGQALQMEEAFCKAKPEARLDNDKRVRYLASILNDAGSLKPEHLFLLETSE